MIAEGKSVEVRKHGGQTVLTDDEEKVLTSHLIALSTYGFPMTTLDLRALVQSYLIKIDRRVSVFRNNMPGHTWATSFLKRNKKELSERMSQNINRSRAAVDASVIQSFFTNLANEVKDVPPSHVWNFDETNVSDNPGSKRVIVKRGCKHPDMIKNSTKGMISLMFCGNAAGELAPVYVCYKSDVVLYECWTEGAPPGTRFNRSKSGWFDGRVFEDWFEFLMLPILKKQSGKKLLIGDNLSSHISVRVLTLCEENDIRFVALPPNSTHLLQPLDVAFFKPTKVAWRAILNDWKETPVGRRENSLPKPQFPRLLNQLLAKLNGNKSANLKAGFRACGISPFNPSQVLNRLCDAVFDATGEHVNNVSQCVMEELQKKRAESQPRQVIRRKKVVVPPGVGITPSHCTPAPDQGEPSAPKTKKAAPSKQQKSSSKKNENSDSSTESSDEEDIPYAESDDSLGSFYRSLEEGSSDLEREQDSLEEIGDSAGVDLGEEQPSGVQLGDFVLVRYAGKLYPGKITSGVDDNGDVCISAMNRKGKNWLWPNPPDEIWYSKDQIQRKIPAPVEMGGQVFRVDMKS